MRPSRVPARPHAVTLRPAGGRIAIAGDGSRVAVAVALPDGAVGDVLLYAPMAEAWVARVAPAVRAGAPTPGDLTPVVLRTPWARGDDGAPALALERTAQGPMTAWRLLLAAGGRALALPLAPEEVASFLRCLLDQPSEVRDAG